MSPDENLTIREELVFQENPEKTDLYLACDLGLARVESSDDQIARFNLARRGTVRDVAGGDRRLLVATDENVLLSDGDTYEGTDFGPAVAVGAGESLLAADADGRIMRLAGDAWAEVGIVDAVVGFDGDLAATATGVVRVEPDGLVDLGLNTVRDVARADRPLAATGDGLFAYDGDEWHLERPGSHDVVASDGDRVHAVADGDLVARQDGEWVTPDLPTREPIVDVGYDEGTFAVTADGTMVLDPVTAKDGVPEWVSRTLGFSDVSALAVP